MTTYDNLSLQYPDLNNYLTSNVNPKLTSNNFYQSTYQPNTNTYTLTDYSKSATPNNGFKSSFDGAVSSYKKAKDKYTNPDSTSTDYIQSGIDIVKAGTGLANAYMGYKNYQLAKDQYNYEKNLANTNLANQAQLINNGIDASANIAAQMSSSPTASAGYNQALRDAYLANANTRKVSGTI